MIAPETLDDRVISQLCASRELDDKQISQLTHAAEELSTTKIEALIRTGWVGDDKLFSIIAKILSWPLVEKVHQCPSIQLLVETIEKCGLNADWCIDQKIFPAESGGVITIYTDRPFSLSALQTVLFTTGEQQSAFCLLTPAMASAVEDNLTRERAVSELFGTTTDIATLAEEAPVINLVNNIVERAIFSEASDIHVEQGRTKMTVRFRVDGRLVEFMQQPSSRFAAIASRIKLMSDLDIAERRLPQDGRFSTRAGRLEYDVRVSTAPDVHGESIVMRLLPKSRDELALNLLGFETDHLGLIKEWSNLSNGIVLVTGPTGSGKSTTLYALLSDLKTGEEKIVTVEDPVEYQLEGITQVQAREEIGYTFAKALRSFLRQDPDIIMVGEIRDKETADIAVQSSLTGHLVLSTLHTNDACSVFPRLADIGVEPYLTAATIQGVQAQRLVRKLCSSCAVEAEAPAFLSQNKNFAKTLSSIGATNWKQPVGCKICHGKGYKGRIGIYELVPVTNKIRALIAENRDVSTLRKQARLEGYRSLMEDGLIKAAKGITTVDEILRVCALEENE